MRASSVSASCSRLGGALLAGVLLCAPPPARANGGWDDDWDDYQPARHRHHHHHSDREHEHGDWCRPRDTRWYGPPPRAYGYQPPRVDYGGYEEPRYAPAPRYYCEPCGRWYDDEDAFHAHLHRHHHVALAVIPFVLAAAAFGWVFAGN